MVAGAHGDEHELDAVGGGAIALVVTVGVGFVATWPELAGGGVQPPLIWLGLEQGGDDFAVGVEHARQVGVGERAGPVGFEQAQAAGPLHDTLFVAIGGAAKAAPRSAVSASTKARLGLSAGLVSCRPMTWCSWVGARPSGPCGTKTRRRPRRRGRGGGRGRCRW